MCCKKNRTPRAAVMAEKAVPSAATDKPRRQSSTLSISSRPPPYDGVISTRLQPATRSTSSDPLKKQIVPLREVAPLGTHADASLMRGENAGNRLPATQAAGGFELGDQARPDDMTLYTYQGLNGEVVQPLPPASPELQCLQQGHQCKRKYGAMCIVAAIVFFPWSLLWTACDRRVKCKRCQVVVRENNRCCSRQKRGRCGSSAGTPLR